MDKLDKRHFMILYLGTQQVPILFTFSQELVSNYFANLPGKCLVLLDKPIFPYFLRNFKFSFRLSAKLETSR